MKALSQDTLKLINDRLNDELLKRGFPSVKLAQIDKDGTPVADEADTIFLSAISNKFQTTPVLYKTLRVKCSGNVSNLHKDDDGLEFSFITITASARITCFNGGTNGVDILRFSCKAYRGFYGINKVVVS